MYCHHSLVVLTFNISLHLLGRLHNSYNHFHNILRLFDVLPSFAFTTNEMMRDYYL